MGLIQQTRSIIKGGTSRPGFNFDLNGEKI
jgi:hypothetical protein